MDLLITQLKAAIRKLLDGKGVRARVLDKVNRHGEVVIGIIMEKAPAAPAASAVSAAPAADVPPRPDKRHVRE